MEKETNSQFFQVDIPEGIISFLEKKSGIFKNNKTSTYGVNQIVRCLRKSFYEKTRKKRRSSKSLDNLWPTVRGDLLHQMTTAYNWNELDMDFQIPLGDGSVVIVSGRLDMYDWKTKTIIDLKTTKDVYSQAQEGTIPKKEDIINLNDSTIELYRRLITNYEHNTLEKVNDQYLLNGKPSTTYTVKQNYYWMMGDNRHRSQDSRYWGYVPETHIVGRAALIWFSYNKSIRWNRLFNPIK